MWKLSTTNRESGFTLVEVLVSVGVMLIFLPFVAKMLTNSQMWSSYSKHKTEAAYVAQQLLETQRQNNPFITLSAGQTKQILSGSVALDTKGNYSNVNCNTNPNLFCGQVVVQVSPEVYTNSSGQQTTNTNIDHFVAQIGWSEKAFNNTYYMTETYSEDVLNDPMLN